MVIRGMLAERADLLTLLSPDQVASGDRTHGLLETRSVVARCPHAERLIGITTRSAGDPTTERSSLRVHAP